MSDLLPKPARLFYDKPSEAPAGQLALSPVLVGGGVFGTDYNSLDTLASTAPEDTLRLAFRYGVTAVDTSPYYTYSEKVLGRAFDAIKDEFPRASYQIITKTGRFGASKSAGFDYSPERIRKSVKNSLELMKTTYLDGLYMHDVEFVADHAGDAAAAGWKVGPDGELRAEDFARWGLADGDEGKILGPGDEKVLAAMATLFELKAAGVVRCVGFSGFPLPTLLRLARLVKAKLQPIDIIQSYCHHTLQNVTLATYLPLLTAAGVSQVISASPLSMGLLRTGDAPHWHPASPALQLARTKAVAVTSAAGTTLQDVALGYGLSSVAPGSDQTPIVVGFSNPAEVHETMRIYGEVYSDRATREKRDPGTGEWEAGKKQVELEKKVVEIFREEGVFNWTWEAGVN